MQDQLFELFDLHVKQKIVHQKYYEKQKRIESSAERVPPLRASINIQSTLIEQEKASIEQEKASINGEKSFIFAERNDNFRLIAFASQDQIKVVYCKAMGNGKSFKPESLVQNMFSSIPKESRTSSSVFKGGINHEVSSPSTSWFVGANIYSKSENGRICKIAWHSLSSTNSHLLVLSSNGILRMFNLAQDIEEPEQTFYVTRTMGDHLQTKASTSFGPNLEEYEAVSFSIGKYSDSTCGWSCCTVYALLASGDIVSLCPVLPNEFSVDREWIHETLQFTRDEWADIGDEIDTKQYYWMCRYLEEILGVAENEQNQSQDSIFHRPLRQFSLGRSGPYLFSPTASVLESEECTPQDILLTSTSTGIPILSFLIDGVLFIGALLVPPTPLWLFDQNQQEQMHTITLIEGISLSSETLHNNVSRLIQDGFASDTLFVQFSHVVYQVQLEVFKYLNDASLVGQVDTCPPSNLKKIVQSINEDQHIHFFLLLPDAQEGFSFLCLGNDGGKVSDLVYPIQQSMLGQITNTKKESKNSCLPELPAFNYNLLANNPKSLSIGATVSTSKKYPDFVDDQSLKKITETISETRVKIKSVIESFDKLSERMKELEHQSSLQKIVLETTDKSLKDSGKVKKLKERCDKIKKRQKDQTAKLVGVLDLLFDMTQPNLSAAEIQWCQELAQLYKQLECFYGPKLLELQVKAKQVQEKISADKIVSNTDAYDVPEILGTRQIRDIKQSLEFEVKELKSLKYKVDKLHIVADDLEGRIETMTLS